MKRNIKPVYAIFLCIPVMLFAFQSRAQEDNAIRIAVKEGEVYVYHNKVGGSTPVFNIYRKDAPSADFIQLNETPVTGITYPNELPGLLGDTYQKIADVLGTGSPAATYLRLRSSRITGRMLVFIYPRVAQAMGNLFVDRQAPVNTEVTYRIVFMDEKGEPSGEVLEKQVSLRPHPLDPPGEISASNKGRSVTLRWTYPRASKAKDDKVIRFNIYRKRPGGQKGERLNDQFIIRNNAVSTFSYTFEALSLGQEETYFVTAVDITNTESRPGGPLTYLVEDNVPPQKIAGLAAHSAGEKIVISWNPGTDLDIAGYNLYRSERMSRGYEKINGALLDPLLTYYTDSTMRQGKNFSYKVAAVDKSGNESDLSLAVLARVKDNTPPASVKNLTAEYDGNKTISLQWDPAGDASAYRTYMVIRNLKGDGNSSFMRLNKEDLRETRWKDHGITQKGFKEGAFYEYGIIVADSARNFSDTTLVTLQIPDLTAPETPAMVSAANDNGIRVSLQWSASTSADVVSYRVYKQAPGTEAMLLTETGKSDRAIRDQKVEKGQKLQYAVTAVDSMGNESAKIYADTVWVKDYEPPRKVRNVRAVTTGEGIKIQWEPVVSFDLAGYRIYRADMATGRYELLNRQALTTTEWTVTQPTPGTWYRVRAVDSSGNESKPSDPRQAGKMPSLHDDVK